MIRRKLVRLAVVGPALSILSLAGLSAVLSTPAAAAGGGATLVQWGWWTQANTGTTGACLPGVVCDASPPVDPSNIHVQVGPNAAPVADQGSVPCPQGQQVPDCQNIYPVAATAVSAVLFKLGTALPFGTDGSTPVANLTLTVAPPPAPQPAGSIQLLACRSDLLWKPAQGGNWSQKAAYNPSGCSAGVPGVDAQGHQIFQFAILAGELQLDGASMSLAIAPPNVPDMQPSNIELETPTAADVALYPPPPGQPAFAVPDQPPAVAVAPGSSLPPSAFSGAPPAVSMAPPAPAVTSPAAVGAVPAAALPAGLTGGRLALVGALLLGLAAGLLAIALDAGRMLSPLGQSAGIGRFAKPRSAPPIPV